MKGDFKDSEVHLVQNLFPFPFRKSVMDLFFISLYVYNVPRKTKGDLIPDLVDLLRVGGHLTVMDPELVRKERKEFLKLSLIELSYNVRQGTFFDNGK